MSATAPHDLYSAFDIVDHLILLDIHQKHFGVTAQNYGSSYTFPTELKLFMLVVTSLSCGVRQSSVLGPVSLSPTLRTLTPLLPMHFNSASELKSLTFWRYKLTI